MVEYNEKVYKKITNGGTAGIVLGVLCIIFGITLGTISIVFGGNMLAIRRHLVD